MWRRVDTSGFIQPRTLDEEELKDLPEMQARAERYLTSHAWCPEVTELVAGYALPPIVGLFLARLSRPIRSAGGVDTELWVVVGDLPSAYFITDDAETPPEALDTYCWLMEEWADRVLSGEELAGCYPVDAEPTREHAEMLKSRVDFIREHLIPASQPQAPAINDP